MKFYLRSIRTWSYWRYALFSGEAALKFFAALGILSVCVDLADDFKVYTKDEYSQYGILIIIFISLLYVLTTRRPVTKVSYKVPRKDITFQVVIGDLFKIPGEVVVSSNSTFDTDMSNGLIAPNSLQGQLALQFFAGQTADIDRQIAESLDGIHYRENPDRPGKHKEYPIGTIARVSANGRNFYLLAMSHLNKNGTAYSDTTILDDALEHLWANMASRAEFGDIVIPAIGSGRGRVSLPRKKIVEKIAQSFADASLDHVFSNKLIIVIRPEDADKFSVNLFEIRDYLVRSLHF
jgi:hypothetical protein